MMSVWKDLNRQRLRIVLPESVGDANGKREGAGCSRGSCDRAGAWIQGETRRECACTWDDDVKGQRSETTNGLNSLAIDRADISRGQRGCRN